MMSVDDLIKKYTYEGVFVWDIMSVLHSLRPNIHYGVEIAAGIYTVFGYPEADQIEVEEYKLPPTHEEVKTEWERQSIIAEVLHYLKHNPIPDGYIPPLP